VARDTQKGFTFIEMILVIVTVGIIGSMAATMLFQGSDIFVQETNRQGFVSKSRAAFWKLFREAQGQSSSANYYQSNSTDLNLKDGNGELKDFRLETSGNFNFRLGTGTYYPLSTSIGNNLTDGFSFINSSYGNIQPSAGGLTLSEAQAVHMTKVDLTFVDDMDTLSLSTWIYPQNFRFGQKMSYHE